MPDAITWSTGIASAKYVLEIDYGRIDANGQRLRDDNRFRTVERLRKPAETPARSLEVANNRSTQVLKAPPNIEEEGVVFGGELRCWNRRRRDSLHVDWRTLCVSHSAYLKNRTLKLSYLLLVMGRAFESLDDLPCDSKHMSRTGVNIIATAVRCLDG